MKIEGNTVIFKSIPEFFEKEREGIKPNTERIMPDDDFYVLLFHSPKITHIRIINSEMHDRYFNRELTDISLISELLGVNLVVLSWKHEGTVEVRK